MPSFAAFRRLRSGATFTPGLKAALAAGVALHLLGLALIGATWSMPKPPPEPDAFVRVSDGAMSEQAELLDPSALFLPTSKNYGVARTRPGAGAAAGEKTGESDRPPLDPPRAGMPDAAAPPPVPPPTHVMLTKEYAGLKAFEKLPRGSGDTALVLGRRAPDVAALPPVGPGFSIYDETTRRLVATGPLTLVAASPTPVNPKADPIRPAEFFISVDAYGFSRPVLRRGSGDPATDARLASALVAGLHGTNLGPGRFIIVATP